VKPFTLPTGEVTFESASQKIDRKRMAENGVRSLKLTWVISSDTFIHVARLLKIEYGKAIWDWLVSACSAGEPDHLNLHFPTISRLLNKKNKTATLKT